MVQDLILPIGWLHRVAGLLLLLLMMVRLVVLLAAAGGVTARRGRQVEAAVDRGTVLVVEHLVRFVVTVKQQQLAELLLERGGVAARRRRRAEKCALLRVGSAPQLRSARRRLRGRDVVIRGGKPLLDARARGAVVGRDAVRHERRRYRRGDAAQLVVRAALRARS